VTGPHYTADYVSAWTAQWTRHLKPFIGRPDVLGLEIGAFEGRSARWFVEHVLTGERARLVAIDPYPKGAFEENVADLGPRLELLREASQTALRDRRWRPGCFDFAYIDGHHAAPSVLEDSVLVFRLLKPGGVLIWDDYPWRQPKAPNDPLQGPGAAIDAFLAVYAGQYDLLAKEWQVTIRKQA
jgi:predicted O-methyltransferase YrrM